MNVEKIEKLIQTLQTYPEFYDQINWGSRDKVYVGHRRGPNSGHRCGTRSCMAGYMVMAEGYSLLFHGQEKTTYMCHKGKQQYDIEKLATKILGLDPKDASILFSALGDKWRHEKEFHKAHASRKVDVAVAELQDLIKLGPYSEEKKRKKLEAEKPVEVAVETISPEKPEAEVLVEK